MLNHHPFSICLGLVVVGSLTLLFSDIGLQGFFFFFMKAFLSNKDYDDERYGISGMVNRHLISSFGLYASYL